MRPVKTPYTMDTLGAPEGAIGVDPLPVNIDHSEQGFVTSIWDLSPEERRQVTEGGQIGLMVMGTTHPPLALAVSFPHCKECEAKMAWDLVLRTFVCPNHQED